MRREDIPPLERHAASYGKPDDLHPAIVAILGDSRWKQWRPVRVLACSPNGRHVASGDSKGNVTIWDGLTGRPRHWLFEHTAYMREITFSADSTKMATAGDDGTVRLWNADDGKLLSELAAHRGPVVSLDFDQKSQRLASGSLDRTVVIWDRQGKPLRTIDASDKVLFVAFNPAGTMLATGTVSGALQLWDPTTGKVLATIPGHQGAVTCGRFTPSGSQLITADAEGNVLISQVPPEDVKPTVVKIECHITDMAIDGAGSNVVVANVHGDGYVYSVGITTGSVAKFGMYRFNGPVAWNAAWQCWMVGWCERDSSWIELVAPTATSTSRNPDAGPILAADMSWDGTRFVVSHRERRLQTLLQLASPQSTRTFSGHTQWDDSIAFSPDGRHVVSAGGNWIPKLWNTEDLDGYTGLGRHKNWILAIDFHPNGRQIAAGSFDKQVKIWSVDRMGCLKEFQGHGARVMDVRFSADGSLLATASKDGTAKIWDVEKGTLIADFPGHSSVVLAATLSPDHQLLATTTEGNNVLLWSVKERRLLLDLKGHTDWSPRLRFQPRWTVAGVHRS